MKNSVIKHHSEINNAQTVYAFSTMYASECEEDFARVFIVAHPSVGCFCLLQREGAVHWHLQRPTGEVGEYMRGKLQEVQQQRNTRSFFLRDLQQSL